MAYEMRPGQGSAFRNEDKREEWHADFKGRVMLPNGTTCWLDVSKKRGADGEVYVAVKIRPMEQRPEQTAGKSSYEPPARREPGNMPPLKDDLPSDDIPF